MLDMSERLRSKVFVRAYNAKPKGYTMSELFENGDIGKILHWEQQRWFDDLLSRCGNTREGFLNFLIHGKFPDQPAESQLVKYAGNSLVSTAKKMTLQPGKPLWRKQEIVRQERIVHYTTVDNEGQVQELVETERSSTEVLHMECNDTGEFAHREASEFEQFETFNREVVAQNHGNEQYVHLKSLDDEIEFMESHNMPADRQGHEHNDHPDRVPEEGEEEEEGEHDSRHDDPYDYQDETGNAAQEVSRQEEDCLASRDEQEGETAHPLSSFADAPASFCNFADHKQQHPFFAEEEDPQTIPSPDNSASVAFYDQGAKI